jgi:hypothetical protein
MQRQPDKAAALFINVTATQCTLYLNADVCLTGGFKGQVGQGFVPKKADKVAQLMKAVHISNKYQSLICK